MRRRGRPQPPNPGEPVPSVPPIGKAESRKGVQGEISPWSQAGGREGEAVSLRALEGDSKSPPSQGAPLRYGGLRAASAPTIDVTSFITCVIASAGIQVHFFVIPAEAGIQSLFTTKMAMNPKQ